jgi:LysR family transcriptional regulator, regulator for bpeEF and oprC
MERQMDRLETIQMFVRVVETGSFSAAVREMRVGQPSVTKQVASLEAHLGAELLKRSSRKVALTDAGRGFYESAVHLLEEYDAATSRVGRGHVAPKGLVRAMVLPTFARLYVVPFLREFFGRYPDISVELLNFDRRANLIEEGIDVAIHSGDLPDSSLIAKKIAETSVVLVATPEYLEKHGTPKDPNQLKEHLCVAYVHHGSLRPWIFEKKSSRIVHHPEGSLRASDAQQIRVAVLNHLGIANGPAWLFAEEIAAGTVRRLLPEYEHPKSIFALRHGSRRLATKTSAFIDFLVELFAKNPQFVS